MTNGETPDGRDQPGESSHSETLLPDGTLPERANTPGASPVTTIGRYLVLSKLGAGAMGVVLAAYDPQLGRKVALKLLKTRPGGDTESARARLQREAQALARVNHINVVAVHDVGVHDGQVFVAMELVAGMTLAEWLESEPRPWREVLRVFVAAGEGLVAAHREGLVHRDFKPENVMLGDDGRVRVMDFGLAREQDGSSAAGATNLRAGESMSSLGVSLTVTGSVMGTPAYMSPEQFEGQSITASSDQFSFCVALYEGLYSKRPFRGDNIAQLAIAVGKGAIDDAPKGTRVPGWLRTVLLKGLSRAPDHRFGSMAELLVQLKAGELRRRRRGALLGAGALVAAGGAIWAGHQYQTHELMAQCAAEAAGVGLVWNEERRVALRTHLLSIGVPYASRTAETVETAFDAQAESIRGAQDHLCVETRVEHAHTEAVFDRATWCLDERRMQLEALASEFARADERSIQSVATASANLLPVAACSDSTQLRQNPEPPSDREAVQTLREELSQARAMMATGRYEDALLAARSAVASSTQLDWPALTAAAHLVEAQLLVHVSRYDAAEATLNETYFDASRIGATETAVEAAIELVSVVGYRGARAKEGKVWAQHALVGLEHLGQAEQTQQSASLDLALANVLEIDGDYTQSEELYRRALATRTTLLGPEHPGVASALTGLANVHHRTGRKEEAIEAYTEALALREAALGPDHPTLATILNNLAGVHFSLGDYERTKRLFIRSLSIREAAFGATHADVASSAHNLAAVHQVLGEFDESIALNMRALEITRATLGPRHPAVASSLGNLGLIHQAIGNPEEARVFMEQALEIRIETRGPDHIEVASTLRAIADAHCDKGEFAEALPLLQRALVIQEAQLGPDHAQVGGTYEGLAKVALGQERFSDAIELAGKAERLRVDNKAASELVASARFLLAQALWNAPAQSGRDRVRARKLAESARATLTNAKGQGTLLEQVQAWLVEVVGRDELPD